MELKLIPEDIDRIIRETIIKSALGKNIEQVINKSVSDCIDRYDSPINHLVREVVKELVKEHLSKPENNKLITEAIVRKITPEAIDSMLSFGIQKLHDYIRD